MKKQTLVYAVMTALVGMQSSAVLAESAEQPMTTAGAQGQVKAGARCAQALPANAVEKCYGVAKAGKNDCATKKYGNGCAGAIKQDRDPVAWILVPKGDCQRIAGGSTVSPEE